MKMVELIGLLLGILTTLCGAIAWYRASVQKEYAAQRDFAHLQRNYQQMSGLLDTLCKEIESNNRAQAELTSEVEKIALGMVALSQMAVESKALLLTLCGRWIKGE